VLRFGCVGAVVGLTVAGCPIKVVETFSLFIVAASVSVVTAVDNITVDCLCPVGTIFANFVLNFWRLRDIFTVLCILPSTNESFP